MTWRPWSGLQAGDVAAALEELHAVGHIGQASMTWAEMGSEVVMTWQSRSGSRAVSCVDTLSERAPSTWVTRGHALWGGGGWTGGAARRGPHWNRMVQWQGSCVCVVCCGSREAASGWRRRVVVVVDVRRLQQDRAPCNAVGRLNWQPHQEQGSC